jgi:hypothetical protein
MKMHNSFRAGLIALSLATMLLPGCGEIKVRAGAPVDASLLESRLVLGRSTEKDVREVMGEPLGVGREWLPFHTRARTVWSYYLEESQASLSGVGDAKRIFLWVFLSDGRYDGFLWVSSFPSDHTPTKGRP